MIHLVRHGSTAYNEGEERVRGWMDVPLDPQRGVQEAEQAAKQLAGKDISHIYSSDLSRAHETAKIIGQATGAPISTDPALRPWHMGVLAGHKMSEVRPTLQWLMHHPEIQVPQGESFNQFKERWSKAFQALRQQNHIAVVTSHSNILVAKDIMAGRKEHATVTEGEPDPGGIVEVKSAGSRIQAPSDSGSNPSGPSGGAI